MAHLSPMKKTLDFFRYIIQSKLTLKEFLHVAKLKNVDKPNYST